MDKTMIRHQIGTEYHIMVTEGSHPLLIQNC